MRVRDLLVFTLCAVALAGCGDEPAPAKAPTTPHVHPPAPHGGEILELGDHEYHIEMIHDHVGGGVRVYILDKDMKVTIPVKAPTINLVTKSGPVQFTLVPMTPIKPDGTADAWKGEHPGLAVDPWDGTIRVEIGGKQYRSPLEGAAHTHD
jgi:hypothetical protein